MSLSAIEWLNADWPAPERVRAISTLRAGGRSDAPYRGLNLGSHVGDRHANVEYNRAQLKSTLKLPSDPVWLSQTHSADVVHLDGSHAVVPEADASVTMGADQVCAVLTADCLPVLFCDVDGTVVAAAHAGWRGLADGILEATVQEMAVAPDRLIAWMGPAIGPDAFRVGADVHQVFVSQHAQAAQAFTRESDDHWLADIYALARLRLQALGVRDIFGGGRCTFSEPDSFFSYRRDGVTGRQASLIWIEHEC